MTIGVICLIRHPIQKTLSSIVLLTKQIHVLNLCANGKPKRLKKQRGEGVKEKYNTPSAVSDQYISHHFVCETCQDP